MPPSRHAAIANITDMPTCADRMCSYQRGGMLCDQGLNVFHMVVLPSMKTNLCPVCTPVCTALSVQKRSCRDADPTGSGTMGSGPAPGIHAH